MPDAAPRAPISAWSISGLVGLAGVLFLIAATRVAVGMPWWAVALLVLAWLVSLVLALAWFSRRPRAVAALPVVLGLVWFATVVAGARWLGWS
ncbi:MAG: hypothetical protein LT071_08810 [Nocardioides sp.]|nr:hypothetical protein [Nocardioides sp.]